MSVVVMLRVDVRVVLRVVVGPGMVTSVVLVSGRFAPVVVVVLTAAASARRGRAREAKRAAIAATSAELVGMQ